MIEIIPNWHPIFVHFTVALYSTAVVFYMLAYLCGRLNCFPKIIFEFETVARWCLWVVGFLVIGTVLAGLYAYNTVRHDAISHIAMTIHRDWAFATAGTMMLVTLWSFWRFYKRQSITVTFIIALLVVQGLLLSTAWRGAELVFRYGLGVLSLPKAETEEHHHHHESMCGVSSDYLPAPPMDNPGAHHHVK